MRVRANPSHRCACMRCTSMDREIQFRSHNGLRSMTCYPVPGQDADHDGNQDMWCKQNSNSGKDVLKSSKETHEMKEWQRPGKNLQGYSVHNESDTHVSSSLRSSVSRNKTRGQYPPQSLSKPQEQSSTTSTKTSLVTTRQNRAVQQQGKSRGGLVQPAVGGGFYPASNQWELVNMSGTPVQSNGFRPTMMMTSNSVNNSNDKTLVQWLLERFTGLTGNDSAALAQFFNNWATYDYLTMLLLIAVVYLAAFFAAWNLVDSSSCGDLRNDPQACARIIIPFEQLDLSKYLLIISIVILLVSMAFNGRAHYVFLITGILCAIHSSVIAFYLTITIPTWQWYVTFTLPPIMGYWSYRNQSNND